MKFCDEKIRNHLLNGGKIRRVSGNKDLDYRPIMLKDNILCFSDRDCCKYHITVGDLTSDDWEIVEPEYDWNKIIKDKILCVFSDNKEFKDKMISILTKVNNYYYTENEIWYKYCRPFNPADFNIAKDLKEYEK